MDGFHIKYASYTKTDGTAAVVCCIVSIITDISVLLMVYFRVCRSAVALCTVRLMMLNWNCGRRVDLWSVAVC